MWPAGGWQAVWRHQLLPGEHALSVAAVRLKDQSTGATVPLLAVGAALPAGALRGQALLPSFLLRSRARVGTARQPR